MLSKLCSENQHEWCANRSYEECNCACDCHKKEKLPERTWKNGVEDAIQMIEKFQSSNKILTVDHILIQLKIMLHRGEFSLMHY
jgi:hypothetical protein